MADLRVLIRLLHFFCYISPPRLNFVTTNKRLSSFESSARPRGVKMFKRCWYPSSLLLLSLLLLFSSSLANPHYDDCSKHVHCGKRTDINVTYPFRLHESPTYCGYPGYELNCSSSGESDVITIKLGGEDYAVQAINYEEMFIVVIDAYFVSNDCPLSFTNTNINSTLFNYTSRDSNLTVYVNCTFIEPPHLPEISCLNNLYFPKKSYYKIDNGPSNFLENLQGSCEQTAAVAAYETSGFEGALKGGFGLTWNNSMNWCRGCMISKGICGYNETGPEDHICFCSDTDRLDSCFDTTKKQHNGLIIGTNQPNKGLVIGVTAVSVCLLLVCISLYTYFAGCNKLNNFIFGKNNIANTIEAFLDTYDYIGPKRYKYSTLKKITNSFSEKLGQGGYGAVFKGNFPDGRLVAVKVLSDTKGNGDEFINEVASIGRTSHVNVVSLLGFSSEGSKRALVYEFMSNGSLEKYIYTEKLKFTLCWEKLYQIAVGIARGLEYLHRGCNTRIVHFDIKPHNILLDQDLCPKISDFGLAQLNLRKDSVFSTIDTRGTIGYIAPEVFSRNFGVVSSKSDVYSYGMMILEMVGVRNTSHSCNESDSSGYYFPHWIYEHYHEIGDMEGFNVTVESEEIVKKMILVGMWCIQTKPGSRPSMSKVVDMLQSCIDDLEMPPKPYLSST